MEGLPMQGYIEKYLNELEVDGKSDKTIVSYNTSLKQFFKWFYDSTDQDQIENVTPMDIKQYKSYLVSVLKRKPATVNKALVTLKGFFSWATENGYISVNITRKTKLIEKQKAAPKWLEKTEQYRFLRTIEQEKNDFKRVRDKAITQLMLGAGLRVDEVANLELQDITINCRSGIVTVRQGKCNKYREVPLNKDVRTALKDYQSLRNSHKYGDSLYLFISERSPKMSNRGIKHLCEEYRYKA